MRLPEPRGEFRWVHERWGLALQCEPLSRIARHCFSTRELFLEGIHESDGPGWRRLAAALGVESDALLRMRQVHGVAVVAAARVDCRPDYREERPEADIAIASDASVGLSVRAADCVPLLIADRRSGAIAAVHAGWKGTAAGAAVAAVRALETACGSEPRDLVAAAGPSIGPCCYEVGPELADSFSGHPDAPRWFSSDRRPRLNLWQATRDQLARAGLAAGAIHVCELCTFDHPELFHSYRRDGAAAGRLVAAIRSARDKTP
jgi:YfiH family protein